MKSYEVREPGSETELRRMLSEKRLAAEALYIVARDELGTVRNFEMHVDTIGIERASLPLFALGRVSERVGDRDFDSGYGRIEASSAEQEENQTASSVRLIIPDAEDATFDEEF